MPEPTPHAHHHGHSPSDTDGSGHPHEHHFESANNPKLRRALWVALLLNALMFFVEIVAGIRSQSASLLADAIDFGGDAANYGVSLWAIGVSATWRSKTALVKGICMLVFGLTLMSGTVWAIVSGLKPEPLAMGIVGILALMVNLGVAYMLYTYRDGDANMRAVWLCTRNDAIGNILVLVASILVGLFNSGWPDHLVALAMAGLAIRSGLAVITLARKELARQSVH